MTGPNTTGSPLPEADFGYHGQGSDGFRVTDAYLNEALSEVYKCRVSIAMSTMPAQPQSLLGQQCSFEITRGSHSRRVCGIVQSVEDVGSDGMSYHLRITMVPSLWLLSQRSNYRIFQDVTAVEVVRQVLADAGLYQGEGARKEDITPGAYATREYCSQFGETDLDFVMRLLAEEGISFYFTHQDDTEILVLADGGTSSVWSEVPSLEGASVSVDAGLGGTTTSESISSFVALHEMRPSGVTQRDYNFTAPRATPDMTRTHPRGATPRVLYEYPGHWTLGDYDAGGTHAYRKHDGMRRTQVRSEALTYNVEVHNGLSNITTLQPGMKFKMQGHERTDHDREYLVVAVEHHAHAPDQSPGGGASPGDRYTNNFIVIPLEVPFRPPHIARPHARGPHTARVMARPNSTEEISVDVHSRVLVQFHWDRPEQRSQTQRPKQSSCWIRVAQSWAGSQYGALFIPRVDMEVVVSFLDGDPDRPLITGCVYNADHMPPNTLPEDLTKSTIRTHSTPGGNGYNELTFKDAAGHEKIYMRAQLDHEVVVRRDQSTAVGRNQSTHVTNDRTVTVDHNEVVIVKNDQNTAIHHHGHVTANDSFTIQVGNSKIELFPDRIVLTSPTIQVHGNTKVEIIGGLVDINP